MGRLSIALVGLPLILVAHRASASFSTAGIAVSAMAMGIAVTAPARGRIVDRYGVRVGVAALTVPHAFALVGLAVAGQTRSPVGVVATALLAGLSAPALPAAMRLEWQRLLGQGDGRIGQAYAFESSAQVSLFVVGPALAGLGVATVGAAATIAAASGLVAVGGISFAMQSRVHGHRQTRRHPSSRSPIRSPGVRTLVVATMLADSALGAVDVAVVAFAGDHGHAPSGGLLLAVFCISSVLGGAAYGARHWTGTTHRRLAILMVASAALLVPLVFADSLVVLAGCLLLAGAPFTAQWATTSLALDSVAPPSSGAEAYNWLSAANSAGVALGSAAAGFLIETASVSAAFAAAALIVAAAACVVTVRSHTLTSTSVAPS
jgi:predicted MFS family arabinose efflux permease